MINLSNSDKMARLATWVFFLAPAESFGLRMRSLVWLDICFGLGRNIVLVGIPAKLDGQL